LTSNTLLYFRADLAANKAKPYGSLPVTVADDLVGVFGCDEKS